MLLDRLNKIAMITILIVAFMFVLFCLGLIILGAEL